MVATRTLSATGLFEAEAARVLRHETITRITAIAFEWRIVMTDSSTRLLKRASGADGDGRKVYTRIIVKPAGRQRASAERYGRL